MEENTMNTNVHIETRVIKGLHVRAEVVRVGFWDIFYDSYIRIVRELYW